MWRFLGTLQSLVQTQETTILQNNGNNDHKGIYSCVGKTHSDEITPTE